MKSPTLLIILDGWGIAPPGKGNAITLAKTPVLDRLFDLYPSTVLGATGIDVGLEPHQMSGSEAGHMNIGAGRVVTQDSYNITESIKDGIFFKNPALLGGIEHAKKFGGQFHTMGLMGNSDSPHSNPEHFRAVLKLAKKHQIEEVYCHFFTDGRDSYPRSALTHLARFRQIMKKEGIGKIASISGRFYAMDRAKNWERLTKAYDAIVFGRGEKAQSAEESITNAYQKNLTDEYILPTVLTEKYDSPVRRVMKNDSIVFWNLRSDRARQFSKLFVANNEKSIIADDMPIIDKIKNLYFVAMTNFGPELDVHTIHAEESVGETLPMALKNISQLYLAESEKYAHITYFLNGGYADAVGGETRLVIPSPVIDSYAKIPQMSAPKITHHILEHLEKEAYDFYAVNFANADMVGHTGDLKATVAAVEVIDSEIKLIAKEVLKRGGNLIITADHGNADVMVDPDSDQPNTFHTKNPVPFLLVSDKFKKNKIAGGVLGNIAPTVLEILETEKPKLMQKDTLIRH